MPFRFLRCAAPPYQLYACACLALALFCAAAWLVLIICTIGACLDLPHCHLASMLPIYLLPLAAFVAADLGLEFRDRWQRGQLVVFSLRPPEY